MRRAAAAQKRTPARCSGAHFGDEAARSQAWGVIAAAALET